ncbi:MAG: signal recognition particle-docking protein FtsY [Candidatus Woesearchaeota archaeon]
MFGFLKDKLKQAVGKFTKDVEKEATVEKKEVEAREESKKTVDKKIEKPVEKKIEKPVEKKEIIEEEKIPQAPEPKKKGFFEKIFGKKETEEIIEEKEELIEELEHSEEIVEEKEIIEEKKIVEKKPEIKPVDKTIDKQFEIKTEKKIEPKVEKIIEKKPEIKPVERVVEKKPEVKPVEKKIEKVIEPIAEEVEDAKPDLKSLKKELPKEEEKKGFFSKITETFTKFNISDEKFEELFWDLELAMLENNVAVEVIDKIKADMKKELMSGKINRKGVDEIIAATLKNSIIDLFDVEQIDLMKKIKSKKEKPYIITVIGVNGSGKTTSIAKLTNLLQKNGLKVVLAASDTFRAAAIQQLEEHANRLNTKLIKHDYNSDPAAVAFDAIKYAEAKEMDVVIIDTAGRLHSNTNLMRELEKVVRVCKPDIKIFVGESITGNDCVEQAKEFDKAVGIDAIILAKADVDEKGGAAISVSYVTKRPIIYLGTGQTYDDLKEFDPRLIIESLEL